MISLKRVYNPYSPEDGQRILVERLWPRGISKEKAKIDKWMKDVAPSTELRIWYNHDIEKWIEFKKRYTKELQKNKTVVNQLKQLIKKTPTTFVFAAKDTKHNSAVVLKEFLESN
jgi:uncharacterized protein YeaO (DUF488 family)